jgi:hypothetical protein
VEWWALLQDKITSILACQQQHISAVTVNEAGHYAGGASGRYIPAGSKGPRRPCVGCPPESSVATDGDSGFVEWEYWFDKL